MKADCECRELKTKIDYLDDSRIKENTKAYISTKTMPELYKNGYFVRFLKFLINEMAQTYNKSDIFCVISAEASFYFFGNYYHSLEQINTVKSRKPALLLRQRIYNLKRMISIGLNSGHSDEEDPERIREILTYMTYYRKFLEQAEDSTDLAIKFWSILLSENPSCTVLNKIGKKLFKSKYAAIKTVKKITKTTTNHMEFLIRYGIYMKYVMHDYISAEQAFQIIVHIKESVSQRYYDSNNFSIFRGDVAVMLLIATIDSNNNATIVEINTEFEQRLKFSRKELIGLSIANIMPSTIAKRHNEHIQKFFKTMETVNINTPRLRFIKDKDGYFLPCRAYLKIIPKLKNGLQFAMFMISDSTIKSLTSYKKDSTLGKTGAILCDSNYKIIGLTRDATKILDLSSNVTKDLVKSSYLTDLFPQLENEDIAEELAEKGGSVVSFSSNQLSIDNEKDDKHLPDANISSNILIWARLVHELHGGTEINYTMVISQIPPRLRFQYIEVEGAQGIYSNSKRKRESFSCSNSEKKLPKPRETALIFEEKDKEKEKFGEISDAASVASVTAMGSTNESGKITEAIRDIQMQSVSKKMPSSIKKLLAGIIVILVSIAALICNHIILMYYTSY